MTAKDRMLSYIDKEFKLSRMMNELMEARGIEIDDLHSTLDDILRQFAIPTATWMLPEYEEQYGLPVNESLDEETRRQLIMAQKRIGRQNLLSTLQAVEPSLSLAWGRLILPFTLVSEADQYDFSSLIVLLERHKPAHTGYTFRVLPALPKSGYTIYANHYMRYRIRLELKCGTVHAGRWPSWSTSGNVLSTGIVLSSSITSGAGIDRKAGEWYSGGIREPSARGIVLPDRIGVQTSAGIARSSFYYSGLYRSGELPTRNTAGFPSSSSAKVRSAVRAGVGRYFYCGTVHSGEEVM